MNTLLDAYKLALFHEVKSQAFYKLAAQVTRYQESRVWLLALAGLEEDHAMSLVRRVADKGFAAGFDSHAYIAGLQESVEAVLNSEEEVIVREGERQALFDLAKGLELQAHENYLAMADEASEPELTQYFRSLAAQEHGHYEELLRIEHTLSLVAGDGA
ncbi:MAG TPA: ferritin family protein [bacterium]|jgi:rubrerythrin